MRKLVSLATAVVTVKSLWWDKLPPEKKRAYTDKAKEMFAQNKETLATKGKEFQQARQDAKTSGSEHPLSAAVHKLVKPDSGSSSGTTDSTVGTSKLEPASPVPSASAAGKGEYL